MLGRWLVRRRAHTANASKPDWRIAAGRYQTNNARALTPKMTRVTATTNKNVRLLADRANNGTREAIGNINASGFSRSASQINPHAAPTTQVDIGSWYAQGWLPGLMKYPKAVNGRSWRNYPRSLQSQPVGECRAGSLRLGLPRG
jgi:hypothetical protein